MAITFMDVVTKAVAVEMITRGERRRKYRWITVKLRKTVEGSLTGVRSPSARSAREEEIISTAYALYAGRREHFRRVLPL
jgi:hypothetical protein